MEFTLGKAQLPQESELIDEFLLKHFFRDFNIVTLSFGLKDNPPPPIPDCADFVVKALDSQEQLVGVAYSTKTPKPIWGPRKSLKEKQVYKFFQFFEQDAQVLELPEGAVELYLYAVHEGYRGRGLARSLMEESEGVAKETGFKYLTICCTNEITANLAKKLGYKEVYRLAYKEYPTLSGREVYLKPTPPDDHLYYFSKEL